MQVPKTHREVCLAYGIPEIGTIFNGKGNFCERRSRELPRGGQSERNYEICECVLRPKLLHWENQARDHSKLPRFSESFSLVQ